MPQPTKAAPQGFAVDTGKAVKLPQDAGVTGTSKNKSASSAKRRPTLTDGDIKVIKRSLPAIKNTKTIEALKATPHSRLARMALCINLPVAEATTALVAAYTRKKWRDMKITTAKGKSSYRSFTGNSERFRVNGSTSQGEFPNCKKTLKQSRVSLSFQERQPAADAVKDAMKVAPSISTMPAALFSKKSGLQSSAASTTKAGAKSDAKRSAKSDAKWDAKSGARPGAKPGAKPGGEAPAKPEPKRLR